ncbi:hypothetical protein [Enterococcus sp. DIV0086]
MRNLLWLILGGTGPRERLDDGCGCIFLFITIAMCVIVAIFYFFSH